MISLVPVVHVLLSPATSLFKKIVSLKLASPSALDSFSLGEG